jgi:hypothetical protein
MVKIISYIPLIIHFIFATWIYMICVGLRSIVKLGQRAVKHVKLTIVAITFPMFPHYSDGSRGPVLILHRNVIQLKNCSTFEAV